MLRLFFLLTLARLAAVAGQPPSPFASSPLASFLQSWVWQGGSASGLGIESVMGTGTYAYDTSSAWWPITTWQGNANVASNMTTGVGPSCCSWSGGCFGSGPSGNQNCVFCSWYTRSAGVWWDAGTYTVSGSVDDGLVMRLIPQSGAAYIAAGSKGCCASGYSFTFTVPTAGMYVAAIQLNNNEFCANVNINSLTWSSGNGISLPPSPPVVSLPPSLSPPLPILSPPPLSQPAGPCACVPPAGAYTNRGWTFSTVGCAFSISLRVNTPGGWDSGGGTYVGLVDASYIPQTVASPPSCGWGCCGLSNGCAGVLGISGSNCIPTHGFALTMGTWCEFLSCGLRAWAYDASLSDVQGIGTVPFSQTQGHSMPGGPGATGLRHLTSWDSQVFQTSAVGYHDVVLNFSGTGQLTFLVDGAALVTSYTTSPWLPSNVTLTIGGSQAVTNVAYASCVPQQPSPSPPPPSPQLPSPPPSPPALPFTCAANSIECATSGCAASGALAAGRRRLAAAEGGATGRRLLACNTGCVAPKIDAIAVASVQTYISTAFSAPYSGYSGTSNGYAMAFGICYNQNGGSFTATSPCNYRNVTVLYVNGERTKRNDRDPWPAATQQHVVGDGSESPLPSLFRKFRESHALSCPQ